MSTSPLNGDPAFDAAKQIALAYCRAWTAKDIEKTMSYVAEDIVCDAPGGRLQGAPAFRQFWADFMGMLTGSQLIAVFGDEATALMLYDSATIPVERALVAEYITVQDGKITSSTMVFDQTPFANYRGGAQAGFNAAQT
jgi:hypothetical protein